MALIIILFFVLRTMHSLAHVRPFTSKNKPEKDALFLPVFQWWNRFRVQDGAVSAHKGREQN